MWCSRCIYGVKFEEKLENQEHLLLCQRLKSEVSELRANTTVTYQDIFSENVEKMNEAVKLFEVAIKTRDKLIKQH